MWFYKIYFIGLLSAKEMRHIKSFRIGKMQFVELISKGYSEK